MSDEQNNNNQPLTEAEAQALIEEEANKLAVQLIPLMAGRNLNDQIVNYRTAIIAISTATQPDEPMDAEAMKELDRSIKVARQRLFKTGYHGPREVPADLPSREEVKVMWEPIEEMPLIQLAKEKGVLLQYDGATDALMLDFPAPEKRHHHKHRNTAQKAVRKVRKAF